MLDVCHFWLSGIDWIWAPRRGVSDILQLCTRLWSSGHEGAFVSKGKAMLRVLWVGLSRGSKLRGGRCKCGKFLQFCTIISLSKEV